MRGWVLLGWLLAATPVGAVELPSTDLPVSATVPASLSATIEARELVPNPATPAPDDTMIGPAVTALDFGPLASNGTFDPDGTGPLIPQPRALNALKAFQVFIGVNAQQRAFTIQESAAPLQSGVNVIPAGAFVVTPLTGVGGDPTKPLPGNIVVGSRGSAVTGSLLTRRTLFSSTGGPAVTMAATFGITDNAALGATATIPTDQPAGSYTTTVRLTVTVN